MQIEYQKFRSRLGHRLKQPLPGTSAHKKMSPEHRADLDGSSVSGTREGAVLIPIFPTDQGMATLFTVRRADLTDHGGQISFPGGKREKNESLVETALRECEEELGILASNVEVIGRLSTLFIPPSRFFVHPFVALLPDAPELTPDAREVELAFQVPLSVLDDPAIQLRENWTIRGKTTSVPSFQVSDHVIWGATAMITAELLEVLSEALT